MNFAELERDNYDRDKSDLVVKLLAHSKKQSGTMTMGQEFKLEAELDCMGMHELRERAVTDGVHVEAGMDHHIDHTGVTDFRKYQKKIGKQEDQTKLLKQKIDDLERRMATPTWYPVERPYGKHGKYEFNKGKWQEKKPHERFGYTVDGVHHDATGKIDSAEAFVDNDQPAWVKLSIAVTVDAPVAESGKTAKLDLAPANTHQHHVAQKQSVESKRSMFFRACCGKPGATDGDGRPTVRREHSAVVAAARLRGEKPLVIVVKENDTPGVSRR